MIQIALSFVYIVTEVILVFVSGDPFNYSACCFALCVMMQADMLMASDREEHRL